MSSGAMAGIVIACLAMLFLLVAALIVFLVCRRRLLAAKPTQSRRPVADVRALQESGCGLPVDIPVEALAREPPPRYTSVDRLSTSSTSHQHDLSVGSLPPPPPYSVQVFAAILGPPPRRSCCLSVVTMSFIHSVCVQDYYNGNQPISLKLGDMIGPIDRKN